MFGSSTSSFSGDEIRDNRMEPHGSLHIFGANGTDSTLRKMLSTDPYTHTDKTQPNSPSSSSLFGESVLENFTLQTNFLRRQQNLQEQQQRNKRKRKESSFSSCSSSSSASLLSLVPNTERRPSSVAPSTVVGGVGEENPFVVGDSAAVREEQCAQRKSEKSLSSGRSADLNECSPRGSRPRDSNNRSMRQQEVQDGGDDEHDSPRRKRPKYDYTRDQMFEVNRLLLFSSSAFAVLLFCVLLFISPGVVAFADVIC